MAASVLSFTYILIVIVKVLFFSQLEDSWLGLLACVFVAALLFYFRYFVQCPKCLNPYGKEAVGIAFPYLTFIPRNYCQSCGKSVDDTL